MKKIIALFLSAVLLLGVGAVSAAAEDGLADQIEDKLHASIQREENSPEWITALPYAQDESIIQLFVVAGIGTDKTTATVSMHERDENGVWKQILSTPGYVGKRGLCPDAAHVEGCGQTPMGVYRFNKAFGMSLPRTTASISSSMSISTSTASTSALTKRGRRAGAPPSSCTASARSSPIRAAAYPCRKTS